MNVVSITAIVIVTSMLLVNLLLYREAQLNLMTARECVQELDRAVSLLEKLKREITDGSEDV